jgi:hypothetical protein
MKRSEKESIDRAAARVVRKTSEPEDIDLAAEATDSAPAKTLPSNAGLNQKGTARKAAPARTGRR